MASYGCDVLVTEIVTGVARLRLYVYGRKMLLVSKMCPKSMIMVVTCGEK